MPFTEEVAINQIAIYEREIDGIANSYDYAKNPDSLTSAMLPAVIHYVPSFTVEPRAHYNVWANSIALTSILFVLPRESVGGKLKFLENEAIPFGAKWRAKFQDDTVIKALLSNMGAVKFFLKSGAYGAGGTLLNYSSTDFVGWVFNWDIVNA